MPYHIFSVAFSRDNLSAFISDYIGNIKMIKWQAGANSGDEFDFTEKPKKVGDNLTSSICLTTDEKYLLIGSQYSVFVFETKTRKVKKEINATYLVEAIILIQDGKKAIIAEFYGSLSILDLETMEIKKIAEKITEGSICINFKYKSFLNCLI